MSVLSVETAGLQSLAGVCTSKSAAVAATAAKQVAPATSFQPSAAAVAAIHTEAGLAGATMAGRLTTTATGLSAAAAGYRAQDEDAAGAIAELPVIV